MRTVVTTLAGLAAALVRDGHRGRGDRSGADDLRPRDQSDDRQRRRRRRRDSSGRRRGSCRRGRAARTATAELALRVLKQVLANAKERGHVVDEAIFRLKAPRHEPREMRF